MLIVIIAIVVAVAAGIAFYWLYTQISKCERRLDELVKEAGAEVNGKISELGEPNRPDEWLSDRRETGPVDEGGNASSEDELDTPFVEDGVQSEAGSLDP